MKTQTKIDMLLLCFSAFGLCMELMRIGVSHTFGCCFLLWNLVLAWVPYLLSRAFIQLPSARSWKALGLFLLWLLFLPNGPYIVTDLIHLRWREPIPIWYDALMMCTLAWLGMLLALVSVRLVHRKLEECFNPLALWPLLLVVFASSGYGIYLGRFARLNSWDFFVYPFYILHLMLGDVLHPISHAKATVVTAIITLLLLFTYSLLHMIMAENTVRRDATEI
jgi:uncharacterized membrane protein